MPPTNKTLPHPLGSPPLQLTLRPTRPVAPVASLAADHRLPGERLDRRAEPHAGSDLLRGAPASGPLPAHAVRGFEIGELDVFLEPDAVLCSSISWGRTHKHTKRGRLKGGKCQTGTGWEDSHLRSR